jgi:hypothetical protein
MDSYGLVETEAAFAAANDLARIFRILQGAKASVVFLWAVFGRLLWETDRKKPPLVKVWGLTWWAIVFPGTETEGAINVIAHFFLHRRAKSLQVPCEVFVENVSILICICTSIILAGACLDINGTIDSEDRCAMIFQIRLAHDIRAVSTRAPVEASVTETSPVRASKATEVIKHLKSEFIGISAKGRVLRKLSRTGQIAGSTAEVIGSALRVKFAVIFHRGEVYSSVFITWWLCKAVVHFDRSLFFLMNIL